MSTSEIYIDSTDRRKVMVVNTWEEGQDYNLSLDSNSVVDFYGRSIDSTGIDFEVGRKNSFGSIDISLLNISDSAYYIVTVLGKEDEIIDRKNVDSSSGNIRIENLVPERYSLQIIEDLNGNKKWDTGKYLARRQPERIKTIELSALESNRTLNETVDFLTLFNKIDTLNIK